MINDMWNWLRIEPTEDKDLIRKAYASQAKTYHPEEHPDEFQKLQDAYKNALRYASGNYYGEIQGDNNARISTFTSFGNESPNESFDYYNLKPIVENEQLVLEGASIRKIRKSIEKRKSKKTIYKDTIFRSIWPIIAVSIFLFVVYVIKYTNVESDYANIEQITMAQFIYPLDTNKNYVKYIPYNVDLNNDGKNDGIYYSPLEDCFMVELYCKDTKQMIDWGKLKDYVDKHPELIYYDEVMGFLK